MYICVRSCVLVLRICMWLCIVVNAVAMVLLNPCPKCNTRKRKQEGDLSSSAQPANTLGHLAAQHAVPLGATPQPQVSQPWTPQMQDTLIIFDWDYAVCSLSAPVLPAVWFCIEGLLCC